MTTFPRQAEYDRVMAETGEDAYVNWANTQGLWQIDEYVVPNGPGNFVKEIGAHPIDFYRRTRLSPPGETEPQRILSILDAYIGKNLQIIDQYEDSAIHIRPEAHLAYAKSIEVDRELFNREKVAANYNKWADTVPSHITVPRMGGRRRKSRRGRKHRKSKTAKRRGGR